MLQNKFTASSNLTNKVYCKFDRNKRYIITFDKFKRSKLFNNILKDYFKSTPNLRDYFYNFSGNELSIKLLLLANSTHII